MAVPAPSRTSGNDRISPPPPLPVPSPGAPPLQPHRGYAPEPPRGCHLCTPPGTTPPGPREAPPLHPTGSRRPLHPRRAPPLDPGGTAAPAPAGPADAGRAGGMGGRGGARAERPRPQTPDARSALRAGLDRAHASNTGRPRPLGARGTARPAPTGPQPKNQPEPGAQPRYRGARNCATSPHAPRTRKTNRSQGRSPGTGARGTARPAPTGPQPTTQTHPLPPNRRRPTPTWGAGL